MTSSRLLLFNVCTSSVMYAAGDHIQQRFEGRAIQTVDWWRSGRMATVGAPIGVLGHYWYILLDKAVPSIAARAVARKVLADQLIFGPVCLTTFFVGKNGHSIHTHNVCIYYTYLPHRHRNFGGKRLKRHCH